MTYSTLGYRIIDVQIGQVKACERKAILQSKAIGSCIAIIAYDPARHIGSLAHVMLPGRAPAGKKPSEQTRYAANAIDAIISRMSRWGSKKDDLEVTLVGAGNVLKRADDTICKDNIESTLRLLSEKGLKIRTQALGGIKRRNVSFDVERGIVFYSEGDGPERQL